LAGSFAASSNYEKPESDVLVATNDFLGVLRIILDERLGPLGTNIASHTRTSHEVQTLLENAVRRKAELQQVFLLSWHHLSAYVSRANVSKAYLDGLAFEDERLQILTSVSFNIKIPSERYQLAHFLVQVVRQQLRPFIQN